MQFTGLNKIFKSEAIEEYKRKWHDGTYKEFFGAWKWIFSFSKKYKAIIIFYTLFGIFSATLGVLTSYISSEMIDIITSKDTSGLPKLIIYTACSIVFSLVLNSVMSRISTKISIYVNNDIQGQIFDKMIDVKWMELNKYKNGDLLNRFNSDVGTISGNAISWIPDLIINIYTFIITFVVLVRMDYIMAIIALASAPVLLVFSKLIMRKQKIYRKRVLEMNSGMMAFETETFYNMDNMKAFGVSGHLSKELRKWQKAYKKYNLEYNMFHIKTNIGLTILQTIVSMGAFAYCLFRLFNGGITYGEMTFFMTQRASLSTKFSTLVSTIPAMLNSAISANRVREIIDLPKEEHQENSDEIVAKLSNEKLSIALNNVTFSYVEDRTVYEGADFTAKAGEVVAILSESGGGKTTLIRLLLGLVDPSEGDVKIINEEGNEIRISADMRRLISYVPQGNSMIMGTIAENMRVVKEDATDEELIEALKAASAWEFVEKIGLNSKVREKGRGLSEGQAQRISIARAMLRKAPILILDEATSALDIETESNVIDGIMKHFPNKTVIVSTHRPSILNKCNRIYRIQDKQIIESWAR